MDNTIPEQTLEMARYCDVLALKVVLTLLIVGTKIAKSDPNCMTKEYRVSMTAIRSSLFGPSRTLTRGCIMREAWSEKLTLRESPSMVWMARLRRAVVPSVLSYDFTMIGITRWRYSSMLAPNVKKESKILIWVLILFSLSSPSNTFKIGGNMVGRKGLNSASSAFPSASMRETIGSCKEVCSHSSVTRPNTSGI